MKETIISLISVVVGATIGLASTFLSSHFQNKIWKKEKQIEHLKVKKENLESKYEKYIKELYLSMEKNGNFDAELFLEGIYSFPKNVRDAISKHTKLKTSKENLEELRQANWHIIEEMKKSLVEIDIEIEKKIDN